MSKTFCNNKRKIMLRSICNGNITKSIGITKFISGKTNKIQEFIDNRGVFADPCETSGDFSLDNISYLTSEPTIPLRLAFRYYDQRRRGNIPQGNKRLWNYKRTKKL